MSNVKVIYKVNNIAAVRRAMGGDGLMDAAMNGGRVIQSQARINVPVDTGNLRASIMTEPLEQKPTRAVVQIGTDVIYARIQELGGTIKPKTAKMLSWITENGERVFARAVRIKAQPYLRPAVDTQRPQIMSAIAYVINAALQRATR